MKKILQIGTKGQLGWELLRTCAPLGEVVALDCPAVDLSDSTGLRELVRTVKPDIIINAAAYTNVDKAESEPELARAINATGPGVLAEEAKILNAVLVHYSTDFVFDGSKGSPYVEIDKPNPLNVYGHTKLEGEQAIAKTECINIIFRTSWMYSYRSKTGFVAKVLEWARERKVLRVVDDQIGSPTSARLLAELTSICLAKAFEHPWEWLIEKQGIYHCAGAGACSRYAWAKEILRLDPNASEQIVRDLIPARSKDFNLPALRPAISSLDITKIQNSFDLTLPGWLESLRLTMEVV